MHETDFDSLYRADYTDTVAMVYAYTGDRAAAQDVVQEAFCRAWQRWGVVSAYEQPGAWVRRVALNLARSRWRHLRVVTAHLVRQRAAEEPAPEPDHVALVTALRTLPENHRRAIVLHHVMDLPLADVAAEMEAPEGTVKSWLSRGRTALAGQLSDDVRADVRTRVTAPDPAEVRDRARQQQRVRRTAVTVTAAVLALLAVAGIALWRGGPGTVHPGHTPFPGNTTPAPDPSVSPISTVAPDDPMRSVRWSTAAIVFDGHGVCPTGRVQFATTNQAASGPTEYPKAYFDPSKVELGDLTGDGLAEAVVEVDCQTGIEDSADGARELAVIQRDAGGTLRVIGWAGHRGALFTSYWIDGRVLYSDEHPWHNDWGYELGDIEAYGWSGSRMEQVADAHLPLPEPLFPTESYQPNFWSALNDPGNPCSGPTLKPFYFTRDGIATMEDGRKLWLWQPEAPDDSPHLVAVGSPRRVMLLVTVSCPAVVEVNGPSVPPRYVLLLCELREDGWYPQRAFFAPAPETVAFWRVDHSNLIITFAPVTGGTTREEVYPIP